MVFMWGRCCQAADELSLDKQEVQMLDSPDGLLYKQEVETACSSGGGGPCLLDVESALNLFQHFCEENQLQVECVLVELMEGCPSCVWANTPGEPLVWASDSFLDMVGWQRSEVLGRPCKFLQGKNITPESHSEVRRLISSKEEGCVSLVNYTKRGEEFESALYICPLYSNGEFPFFLASQMDIRGCLPRPPPPARGTRAESKLELRVGGVTMLANEGPMSFDNEWVTGNLLVYTKKCCPESTGAAFFEGPARSNRILAVQVQIQFKKVPENAQWFIAGEIDGAANVSFGQKIIANLLLTAIKVWDKTMSYSFGSESSVGFISSTLSNWVDLSGPIVAGKTYCWESGSSYFDAEEWQIVNAPRGRTISFTPFWGKRPVRVVLYASQSKKSAWTRALEVEVYWRGHEAVKNSNSQCT